MPASPATTTTRPPSFDRTSSSAARASSGAERSRSPSVRSASGSTPKWRMSSDHHRAGGGRRQTGVMPTPGASVVAVLFRDRLAGAAHLLGEVLQLGKAIFNAQYGRLVVDVHLGGKWKFRDGRRVDVDQTPLRVPRQQMASAELAPLPIGPLVLVVLADLVFSMGHLDRLGLPERECVDRAGGPAPTGGAMAIAGSLGIARGDDLDGAAEALPFESLFILAHEFFFRWTQGES